MNKIILGFLGLATVAAVISVKALPAFTWDEAAMAFLPNLATELLALAVTLAVVQGYLDKRDAKRSFARAAPARSILLIPLMQLAELGVLWLRSIGEVPVSQEAATGDISKVVPQLNDHTVVNLRELPDPGVAARWSEEFRTVHREAIALYGSALPAPFVAALGELAEDQFLFAMRDRTTPETVARAAHLEQMRNYIGKVDAAIREFDDGEMHWQYRRGMFWASAIRKEWQLPIWYQFQVPAEPGAPE